MATDDQRLKPFAAKRKHYTDDIITNTMSIIESLRSDENDDPSGKVTTPSGAEDQTVEPEEIVLCEFA